MVILMNLFLFRETTKDGVMKLPDARRFLFFTLNLPTTTSGNNCDTVFEEMKPFFQFIFYTIDRMKRVRLSKEVGIFSVSRSQTLRWIILKLVLAALGKI